MSADAAVATGPHAEATNVTFAGHAGEYWRANLPRHTISVMCLRNSTTLGWRPRSASVTGLLLVGLFSIAAPHAARAQASAPAGPNAPTVGHERLAFFVGDWTVADSPPERAFREQCTWMAGGRRHVLCRSRFRTSGGEWREGLSIFSYRAADSTYLYHGFRSGGAVEALTGRATEDGWEFGTQSGTGAARQRLRVTITRLPGGRFQLIDATATGEGPFVPGDTTRYVRASPAP